MSNRMILRKSKNQKENQQDKLRKNLKNSMIFNKKQMYQTMMTKDSLDLKLQIAGILLELNQKHFQTAGLGI